MKNVSSAVSLQSDGLKFVLVDVFNYCLGLSKFVCNLVVLHLTIFLFFCLVFLLITVGKCGFDQYLSLNW